MIILSKMKENADKTYIYNLSRVPKCPWQENLSGQTSFVVPRPLFPDVGCVPGFYNLLVRSHDIKTSGTCGNGSRVLFKLGPGSFRSDLHPHIPTPVRSFFFFFQPSLTQGFLIPLLASSPNPPVRSFKRVTFFAPP